MEPEKQILVCILERPPFQMTGRDGSQAAFVEISNLMAHLLQEALIPLCESLQNMVRVLECIRTEPELTGFRRTLTPEELKALRN